MTASSDKEYPGVEGLSATSLPARVAAHYARFGSDEERLALAANPALPTDVALVLSRDASLGVRQTLAGNNGTEAEVLWMLSQDADLDAESVGGNWNAPVALKLSMPLWKMTRRSLDKFLLSVQADPEERDRLLMTQARCGPRSKLLLGDAWKKIR
ncbi:hypothetical protein [Curtobacterium sp. AG1037]|uniref:hypothetical protein n=1 Tax=Curtobacterium sp. AG1037 TaxID=2183990 RepID=UPI0011C06E90|nr:hypothetical protein [Curtobacterium sp. AG1037]